MLLITSRFDTGSGTISQVPHPFYALLFHAGKLVRIFLAATGALIIFSIPRHLSILEKIDQHSPNVHWAPHLFMHMLAGVAFYYLCALLLEDIPGQTGFNFFSIYILGSAWLLTGLAAAVNLFLLIAGKRFWTDLIYSQSKILLAAGLAGLLAWLLGILATIAWDSLALQTFRLASWLLSILERNITADPINFTLGAGDFFVNISPACSGYEGMGLITAFLSLYLWLFRKELRFPRVFILFPFSIIAIWLLNVFRIVMLILIGAKFSPEIAIGGFHSSAGWIGFIFLSIVIILACRNMAFFKNTRAPLAESAIAPPNNATALLTPFVVLMASILITTAMSNGFDWLYPLKVIISAISLWFFRYQYRRYKLDISLMAVLIGIFVFGLWLLLAPISASEDEKFAGALFLQQEYVVYFWLFFRFVGATITVPIIEELAFRGYLIAKLVNKDFEQVAVGKFTWISFLASSFLFGILHGQWLAGFLAGLCYALALYRRGELVDAITAHMTTNLLLSFFILSTGHWSLW
ncbi:MAG: exosortase E/protease, VPEID-CTERM system [Methylomonas sp.]